MHRGSWPVLPARLPGRLSGPGRGPSPVSQRRPEPRPRPGGGAVTCRQAGAVAVCGAGRWRAPPSGPPPPLLFVSGRRLRRGRVGGVAPKFAGRPALGLCGCCGYCWVRRVSAGGGGVLGRCLGERGRATLGGGGRRGLPPPLLGVLLRAGPGRERRRPPLPSP